MEYRLSFKLNRTLVILGDILWYVAISMAVARGRTLFTDRTYQVLIGCCGAFLVAFAGYLLYSGIAKLR